MTWRHDCVFSNDLLPFAIRRNTTQAIIPVRESGMLDSDPCKNKLWLKAETIWKKRRTIGANNPETLIARIDFNSRLAVQLPLSSQQKSQANNGVIYNTSGQYLRASRYTRTEVVESGCYWWQAEGEHGEQEAAYLVAIMNSDELQPAFQNARKSDRDFHLNIWRSVPIPKFDPSNSIHMKLSRQCVLAEKMIQNHPHLLNDPSKQLQLSRTIRSLLRSKGIMKTIDALVSKLMK